MNTIFPRCDERLIKAIKDTEYAIVIAHRNPDGDALYSSLAMERILSGLGKKVLLLNEGPFLRDDIRKLEPRFRKKADKAFVENNPLVIILDCSTPDRPGEPFRDLENLSRVVIDHHSSGIPFTEDGMSYIVPSSPSTTILVDIVREQLGAGLDRETADYLYRGFATDTGFFHFLSAEAAPECLRRVSAFTAEGISPYEIYDEMHDGRKLQDIKDTASIILSSRTVLDGRLIIAYQPESMQNARLSDGVYASLLEAENVMAVLFLKDKGDAIEIGLRSKNKAGVDVGSIAALFGGGGHSKAAGATITGKTLGEAEEMVRERLEEAILAAVQNVQ